MFRPSSSKRPHARTTRHRLVNSGIYCFRSDLLWKHIDEIRPDNPAHEYYLTDMAEILRAPVIAVAPFESRRSDRTARRSTTASNWPKSTTSSATARRSELMLDGVTIEKPETVTIDAPCASASTPSSGLSRRFSASTRSARIARSAPAPSSGIRVLADGVKIAPFTLIADSRIEAGAHMGPFARLRMNNVVGAEAHIGNFVELKNTRLGAGAKASHLAYLGDPKSGERATSARAPSRAITTASRSIGRASARSIRRQQFDTGGSR